MSFEKNLVYLLSRKNFNFHRASEIDIPLCKGMHIHRKS